MWFVRRYFKNQFHILLDKKLFLKTNIETPQNHVFEKYVRVPGNRVNVREIMFRFYG